MVYTEESRGKEGAAPPFPHLTFFTTSLLVYWRQALSNEQIAYTTLVADVSHAAAREGGGQACSLKGVFWAPSGFNIHTMIEKYRENLYNPYVICQWENTIKNM